ncbi:MAG TPA: hypothetical protein VMU83_08000, partial [Hanamia sp.]|nr:hypothetical protein [Hanamia sp.]
YYPDVDPMDFTEDMLMGYLLYLSKTLGCSRVKCRMAAQSISFFMRHVAKRPYPNLVIFPSMKIIFNPFRVFIERNSLINNNHIFVFHL